MRARVWHLWRTLLRKCLMHECERETTWPLAEGKMRCICGRVYSTGEIKAVEWARKVRH
jgi:hypothetical protein